MWCNRNLEQSINKFTAKRDLSQNDMLSQVSYDVKTVRREFSVSQVNKKWNYQVNDLETFYEMMLVLFDEAQVSQDKNNTF